MICILSPAKTMKSVDYFPEMNQTEPTFITESQELVLLLKQYTSSEIVEMMSISSTLAQLNFERFQNWDEKKTDLTKAIFAYQGDVYTGLDAKNMSNEDLHFAQKHLRIVSGLYGVVKPFDAIKPYRLEMSTKLMNNKGDNLYNFWTESITQAIVQSVNETEPRILINLASNEYSKAIDSKKTDIKIISPEFKDSKDGNYKIISFFAKKARGMMARYIITNRIKNIDDLKHFDMDGYFFNEKLSTENKPVFTRG
ncbi:MAG: peroxide stress protein YaaA [Bacteroidales bacterium]|nr:peroxide stress protein YaaA [Bacteroidales bacterium]